MEKRVQLLTTTGFAPVGSTINAPCWSRIGIDGDGSCPELAAAIHCRNCHVYTDRGRALLDRPMEEDYRREWAARLAEPEQLQRARQSVVIFSLQSELLSLPAIVFKEIAAMRVVRRVPGTRNRLLLGMVNIRGELQLCVSMRILLGLETAGTARHPTADTGRLLLLQDATEAWAFPVDEVHGMHRFNLENLNAPPATVEKSQVRFTRGTLDWKGKSIGCLDESAIFKALKGSMA